MSSSCVFFWIVLGVWITVLRTFEFQVSLHNASQEYLCNLRMLFLKCTRAKILNHASPKLPRILARAQLDFRVFLENATNMLVLHGVYGGFGGKNATDALSFSKRLHCQNYPNQTLKV